MLPCNVIVQEYADGAVGSCPMQAIGNPGLAEVAKEVQAKLKRVVNGL